MSFSRLFFCCFSLALLVLPLRAQVSTGEPVEVTLFFTNDLHAQLRPDSEGHGGWAQIAGFVRQERVIAAQQGRRVFFFDAGGVTQGSALSTLFDGVPLFDIMNAMGYDGALLGDPEWTYGADVIREYRAVARFPLIAANVHNEQGEPAADAGVLHFTFDGLRLAVLGVTGDRHLRDRRLQFLHPVPTVMEMLPRLEAQADVVILLSHLGLARDTELVQWVRGVHFIAGGYTQEATIDPVEMGPVIILQAGGLGQYLGRLDLRVTLQPEVRRQFRWSLLEVPPEGTTPDPQTAATIKFWEDRLPGALDRRLGVLPSALSRESLRATLETLWEEHYRVDHAFVPAARLAGGLPEGPVTARQVFQALPGADFLMRARLTRAEMRKLLPVDQLTAFQSRFDIIARGEDLPVLLEAAGAQPLHTEPVREEWRDALVRFFEREGNLDVAAYYAERLRELEAEEASGVSRERRTQQTGQPGTPVPRSAPPPADTGPASKSDQKR